MRRCPSCLLFDQPTNNPEGQGYGFCDRCQRLESERCRRIRELMAGKKPARISMLHEPDIWARPAMPQRGGLVPRQMEKRV